VSVADKLHSDQRNANNRPACGPCHIIVMAKAPAAGFAKTRLIPALGAEGAARLAARFLRETLLHALAAGQDVVELCGAPGADHPAFEAPTRGLPISRSSQGEGDLGERIARAMAPPLAQGHHAVLVGTDAPALDAAYLRLACAALEHADAVFGPAADGGYALVGLRRPLPQVFERIPWSTNQVMAQTRERLNECGARWHELPVLYDVDEAPDLVHVPPDWL
jgi:uncharacterized protein